MPPVSCVVGRCVVLLGFDVRLALMVLTIRCSSSKLVSVVNSLSRNGHSLCADNVVREALKQRLRPLETASTSPAVHSPRARMAWEQVERLHQQSLYRCKGALRTVVSIIKVQLDTTTGDSPFFAYDACLVRDACFYAALLLATSDSSSHTTSEESLREEINVCLRAIRSMRFAFARSDDRERLIDQEWERRQAHNQVSRAPGPPVSTGAATAVYPTVPPPISIPTFRDFQPGPDRIWDGQSTSHASRPGYDPTTPLSAVFPSSIYQAPPLPTHASYTPPGSNASRPSTADAVERSSHYAYAAPGAPSGTLSPLDASFHYSVGSSALAQSGYVMPLPDASSSTVFDPAHSGGHGSAYPWT
jgi:hypothetical protein